MMKITLAVTAAAFIVTATPLLAESASAQSENLNLAQVQVAPGVEVGPGGVTVGKKHKKQRCRTVTTTEETADGRTITKKERRCEDKGNSVQ
jgi:Spy/CpxP family protein refolding chaperone